MKEQIHKRLTDDKVKSVLEMYLNGAVSREKTQELLGIKKTLFFDWFKRFKNDPDSFSVGYERNAPTNRIDRKAEDAVINELEKEHSYIANRDIPIRYYNYSYIKNLLEEEYGIVISVPTVIKIAKKKAIIFRSSKRSAMTGRCLQATRGNWCSTIPAITCLRRTPASSGIS
ncbi:MAG: hypothetical protein ACYCUT_01155 [bacterium]